MRSGSVGRRRNKVAGRAREEEWEAKKINDRVNIEINLAPE